MTKIARKLCGLVAVAVLVSAAVALAAPTSAQARTFYMYRNGFSPSVAEEGSGVTVTFFNMDSIPHRIVSDQVYASERWSLDITLMPWEGYTVPRSFSCSYPSCGASAKFIFRDPSRSKILYDSWYSWCSGYCGTLWVHH
jgi:plastocyanin